MMGKIIDGKAVSREIYADIKTRVSSYKNKYGRVPGLATLLVGDNPASRSYVRSKIKRSEEAGFTSYHRDMDNSSAREQITGQIKEWNNDNSIDGILVQLPLPEHLRKDTASIMDTIDPAKDVDGFHSENAGLLARGTPRFIPCTPRGIIELLKHEKISTEGKHAVIIGRSQIVGLPLSLLLLMKSEYGNATVTVCHSRTRDISSLTQQADIVITALGKARFLTAEMIKQGAVVIDVGINRVNDPAAKKGYRIVGDVDTEVVLEKASAVTPVPGGVGPMTIAMLLLNTLNSFEIKQK
ncbi:MAG: bifunctional methylenetetrahydrofolate dehydrogenase/methenyltetrahydrofolate cyclohydrolase FolD [Spirochaetales bacterium]|nr:bifunctional methylenetetrahydrofolate dehydrogenase/methenyltetrahydrofolate cyclohydrolase FolD [Spirochaetales bacterium]